jgi:glycosyltransferase involved in cell wall biosynthesis
MKPVVSIITPSFNRADIVAETADSIFRQTFQNWEWIVVDDGSSDETAKLFEQWSREDNRVQFYRRDRNPKGACACRNIAIEKSSGDYLIFLDTDDLLASFCLEQRVQAMEQNPEADFIIFPMLMFKNKPDDLKLLWNIDKPIHEIDRLLWGDALCQGTGTIWKKSRFLELGGWRENLMLWQDVELHLRVLGMDARFVKCMDAEPDIFIRVSEQSISRTGFHQPEKFKSRVDVFSSIFDLFIQKQKLEFHISGFRYLFIQLFKTACKLRYTDESACLLNLKNLSQLFSNEEIRFFKRFKILTYFYLHRLSYVEHILEQKFPLEKYHDNITLVNQPYKKEVRC